MIIIKNPDVSLEDVRLECRFMYMYNYVYCYTSLVRELIKISNYEVIE